MSDFPPNIHRTQSKPRSTRHSPNVSVFIILSNVSDIVDTDLEEEAVEPDVEPVR